jgi:cytochrome c peroxidase
MKQLLTLSLLAIGTFAGSAQAALIDEYIAAARAEDPKFAGFSAERGRAFFIAKQSDRRGTEACAACHTKDPKAQGSHSRTGKLIQPLAPVANPERLTDKAKVEKWFKRNCNDVLERACTNLEKGDFLAYLINVR